MKRATGLLIAGALAAALLHGADAERCRLPKSLYEDRLALARKQGPAEGGGTGGLLPSGKTVPAGKLGSIDDQYRQFLSELSDTSERKDAGAMKACCDLAGNDRAGALFCQLSLYLAGGRTDAAAFLDQFPGGKNQIPILWDLDPIAGSAGKNMYPPQGPAYKLIDELFLLVMDERETAIVKYFNLSSHASGETAKYMDGQIRTFLKEAPSAVVNEWLVLWRYRAKLKVAAQSLHSTLPPAEMQKLQKTVRAFCDKSNPDCPDILKLYGGK